MNEQILTDSEIKQLMEQAIDTATMRGATYTDVRITHMRVQNVSVKDGIVTTLESSESAGFGVRALFHNGWGFASSNQLAITEMDRIAKLAVEIAKASNRPSEPARDLGPAVKSTGRFVTPVKIDPFTIPLEAKIDLLLQADASMGREAGVRTRMGDLTFQREDKWFANSEGAFTSQTLFESGCGIQSVAVSESEVQTRSYPGSLGRYQVTGGWEEILAVDLPANAPKVASEAVALLTADLCPSGITTTLILGGSQLALQVHESCGHATELDRVFGWEAGYAGTSFLTTDKLGTFQYGSPIVNLTADSVRPLGLGTFGWDDEGVPAQSNLLVKEGILTGFLMSRETAPMIGKISNGCMRAEGWNRTPIVRMVNISLEPGTWSFDDLIADTDDGIYMETNRSWSIDDRRLNFQFGTEIGYEIKHGKLGKLFRNPTYAGNTPIFWNSCDAICGEKDWRMWGTPNCGKGQPGQVAHTGHGAAPARFRNINVGVLK